MKCHDRSQDHRVIIINILSTFLLLFVLYLSQYFEQVSFCVYVHVYYHLITKSLFNTDNKLKSDFLITLELFV